MSLGHDTGCLVWNLPAGQHLTLVSQGLSWLRPHSCMPACLTRPPQRLPCLRPHTCPMPDMTPPLLQLLIPLLITASDFTGSLAAGGASLPARAEWSALTDSVCGWPSGMTIKFFSLFYQVRHVLHACACMPTRQPRHRQGLKACPLLRCRRFACCPPSLSVCCLWSAHCASAQCHWCARRWLQGEHMASSVLPTLQPTGDSPLTPCDMSASALKHTCMQHLLPH